MDLGANRKIVFVAGIHGNERMPVKALTETGAHTDERSYHTTLDIVNNLNKDTEYPVSVYGVYDEITKPGEYINFQEHQAGFIPILANESAYERQGLFGLKARKL